jgi:hypothetical protein
MPSCFVSHSSASANLAKVGAPRLISASYFRIMQTLRKVPCSKQVSQIANNILRLELTPFKLQGYNYLGIVVFRSYEFQARIYTLVIVNGDSLVHSSPEDRNRAG